MFENINVLLRCSCTYVLDPDVSLGAIYSAVILLDDILDPHLVFKEPLTIFHTGSRRVHHHQQCAGFQLLHMLTDACCLFLNDSCEVIAHFGFDPFFFSNN